MEAPPLAPRCPSRSARQPVLPPGRPCPPPRISGTAFGREVRRRDGVRLWSWLGRAFVLAWNVVSVRFGECVLDKEARQLLRGGSAVPLTAKAFQLLELLVEKQPKAVAKTEIHDRLWPSTFVSEVNLARLIFEVRAAVGDDARRPRYIRTVRGFGYALCADVVVDPGRDGR